MAMVQPKSQKARLFITHLLLLLFIAAIMFPLLMVVAFVSLFLPCITLFSFALLVSVSIH